MWLPVFGVYVAAVYLSLREHLVLIRGTAEVTKNFIGSK